jgi:hypothetical protein
MRIANRILTGLLGLALVALGLSVVVDMARVASGREPVLLAVDGWYRWLTSVSWGDGRVLGIAILLGVVGLALLVFEVRPWPPDRVRVVRAGAGAPWWVSRRSVERRAAAAASETGVSHARAAVRGRANRWRLRVRADGWPNQRPAVVQAVYSELDRLDAPPGIGVDISLRRPRRRVA